MSLKRSSLDSPETIARAWIPLCFTHPKKRALTRLLWRFMLLFVFLCAIFGAYEA